jgi:hypothetical protein
MGNASFDVGFEFVNEFRLFPSIALPNLSLSGFRGKEQMCSSWYRSVGLTEDQLTPILSYMAVFTAFASLLNGNVSTTLMSFSEITVPTLPALAAFLDGNLTLYDGSSKILQTGLSACGDFVHTYWDDNALVAGELGPIPWTDAVICNSTAPGSFDICNSTPSGVNSECNSTGIANTFNFTCPKLFSNISNNLFTKPSWMCRSRTLARGIEYLANNITISMLGSSNLV